jgi:NifU-like protein involved in Fe-S cluster formation
MKRRPESERPIVPVTAIYPKTIFERLCSPNFAGTFADADAYGRSASFACGTFVEFTLEIARETKRIERLAFRSNGCGYMVASADALADALEGSVLTELHGSGDHQLMAVLVRAVGTIPPERLTCTETVFAALKQAFADFRQRQIEEFAGETIESIVRGENVRSVARVGELCRAGTGCGSCQMLISEIIDAASAGPL